MQSDFKKYYTIEGLAIILDIKWKKYTGKQPILGNKFNDMYEAVSRI